MHISRIEITNFRNFGHLNVELGTKTVVVGENNVGKSNLLFALRLLFDPALPDAARELRQEDFWDGMTDPIATKQSIEVIAEIQGFEGNKNLLSVLQGHLVASTPAPTARLTYRFRPRASLPSGQPQSTNDYEFIVFGGIDEKNRVGQDVRRWLPLDLLPALRDSESDLASWRRSPLRPLIERLQVDDATLKAVAQAIDAATGQLQAHADVQGLEQAIADRLTKMVGQFTSIGPSLGFASTKPDRLLRTLNMFGDGPEKRPIGEMSLGFLNVLYLLLLAIELERKEGAGERASTLLAIEEPEAHLHPHLQRLLFKDFLRRDTPLLLTTHSPHIASVTPLLDLLLLREDRASNQSVARSALGAGLSDQDAADLERYLDATRAEILFARGVILVEGAAELFLVPAIASGMGISLDEHGVTVCAVHGIDFAPYAKLLGQGALAVPHVVITDFDPYETGKGTESRGMRRGVNLADALGVLKSELDGLYASGDWEQLRQRLAEVAVFVGGTTLETDLVDAGLLPEIRETFADLHAPQDFVALLDQSIAAGTPLDPETRARMLRGVERMGKGRFAQRLAARVDAARSPAYVKDAITRIVELVNQA